MCWCGELGHVAAGFRDDDLGDRFTDTRDGAERFNPRRQRLEAGIDAQVQGLNSLFEAVNLIQMQLRREGMMGVESSVESFDKLFGFVLQSSLGEGCQGHRIPLPGDEGFDHEPA